MAKPAEKKSADKKEAAPTVHKPAVIPELRPGDLVNVQVRIKEGDKERLQAFQGTIIGMRGAGQNRTFTVRKVSRGFGIERIFPVNTPAIASVEVKRHSKVRRAKLYYLRKLGGREAMLKERKVEGKPRPQAVAE
jgi:large subunit ribosomal protein L19